MGLGGIQLQNSIHQFTHTVEHTTSASLAHSYCIDWQEPLHSHAKKMEKEGPCFWCTNRLGSLLALEIHTRQLPALPIQDQTFDPSHITFTKKPALLLQARAPPQFS